MGYQNLKAEGANLAAVERFWALEGAFLFVHAWGPSATHHPSRTKDSK